MSDSKESQSKCSRNAAELLPRLREKQAQHDENCIEVGTVYGACFIYHPEGCNKCSGYLEHLLEDISQHPARFSFSRDEILNGVDEAWPHITKYIHDMDALCSTLEKELEVEKADNRQLRSELDDLDEKIQELEARLLSLQPETPTGDRSVTVASNTDISSSDVASHPLVPEQRPEYWSLYMWNVLKDWHTNPMSIPNAIRDNHNGYFLEEDIDVATWISKVAADISHPAFMNQMKAVFGSRVNFEMAFSGFDKNLLTADHETTISSTSQEIKTEKLPKGPDFLALVLKHCALSRVQIYDQIIPYMSRHEEKRPFSRAGSERAAYTHINHHPPAHYKGKRPVTGLLQSRLSAHAPTPVKTGESSRQRLDEDLDSYNQVQDPVLPYEEEPPSGEPAAGNTEPPAKGVSTTLTNESHMDVDPELDDIYS
ncbi:hypothetical protein M422DRAFT_270670 [Sphaerobolus stellatus SS14]|uniref:Uncharacterized protein n=1 Tax=Sphaerobolus stellatus (strain SS14) TaxID=990650 RepID=A0A0C9UGH8_SPHS4|nr:hypothetical protein M422DRAFT_270670 [Sphaerobolus stellatus SS14]